MLLTPIPSWVFVQTALTVVLPSWVVPRTMSAIIRKAEALPLVAFAYETIETNVQKRQFG